MAILARPRYLHYVQNNNYFEVLYLWLRIGRDGRGEAGLRALRYMLYIASATCARLRVRVPVCDTPMRLGH
jgi:hypothetical protein